MLKFLVIKGKIGESLYYTKKNGCYVHSFTLGTGMGAHVYCFLFCFVFQFSSFFPLGVISCSMFTAGANQNEKSHTPTWDSLTLEVAFATWVK